MGFMLLGELRVQLLPSPIAALDVIRKFQLQPLIRLLGLKKMWTLEGIGILSVGRSEKTANLGL